MVAVSINPFIRKSVAHAASVLDIVFKMKATIRCLFGCLFIQFYRRM